MSGFFSSGLGYIVAAAMTNLTGDWRWGLRITPILIFITVILMIFFMADPERGETEMEYFFFCE